MTRSTSEAKPSRAPRPTALRDVLGAVGEQLHRPGGELVLLVALEQPERVRALDEDVHASVVHPLEHLGHAGGAADLLQAVVRQPDDAELALVLEAERDHRLVTLLEDVKRDDLGRQQHDRQREEREVVEQLSGHPGAV